MHSFLATSLPECWQNGHAVRTGSDGINAKKGKLRKSDKQFALVDDMIHTASFIRAGSERWISTLMTGELYSSLHVA